LDTCWPGRKVLSMVHMLVTTLMATGEPGKIGIKFIDSSYIK
jgi:hypothetical protein